MAENQPNVSVYYCFYPLHLKGRFSGKSQGYNLYFITPALTMSVRAKKVFCGKYKKIDDNTITDYLTLLLSCRLLVIYYVIKTPLKLKSPYDFHRRLMSATSSRTDSLIPLKYLVLYS